MAFNAKLPPQELQRDSLTRSFHSVVLSRYCHSNWHQTSRIFIKGCHQSSRALNYILVFQKSLYSGLFIWSTSVPSCLALDPFMWPLSCHSFKCSAKLLSHSTSSPRYSLVSNTPSSKPLENTIYGCVCIVMRASKMYVNLSYAWFFTLNYQITDYLQSIIIQSIITWAAPQIYVHKR